MGNIFSSYHRTLSAVEYQNKLNELRSIDEQESARIAQLEHDNKQILKSQFERQKNIAKTRMEEIKETIRRAKEIREAQKLLNVRVAVLLCALYFNYPFGTLDMDSLDKVFEDDSDIKGDDTWQSNAKEIVEQTLTKEVFFVMCKIPQLLPLFWPTGDTEVEQKFHDYKHRDANGKPIPGEYEVEVNTYIDEYLKGPMQEYVRNVFRSNCQRDMNTDSNEADALDHACTLFRESVVPLKDTDDLVYRCIQFVKNEDKMNWKCFCARGKKSICSKRVLMLPSTYPKRCPKYELHEAIIMLTNTVLSQYGYIQDATTGARVPAEIVQNGSQKVDKRYSDCTSAQKDSLDKRVEYNDNDWVTVDEPIMEVSQTKPNNTTNGGQCFDLNRDWVDKCYRKAITDSTDTKVYWDGKTYVTADSVVLTEDEITEYKDEKVWMTTVKECNRLDAYYVNPNDKIVNSGSGLLRYVNPTKGFTYKFLNDNDNIEIDFRLPLLNANINPEFRKSFVYNVYVALIDRNNPNNVFDEQNKMLMTSIDFMTMTPPKFADDVVYKGVSPLARFMYEILIEYSCQWNVTFPLINTMTTAHMTPCILKNNNGNKKILPQYIWTRSNITTDLNNKVQTNRSLADITPPAQKLLKDLFVVENILNVESDASKSQPEHVVVVQTDKHITTT